MNKILFPSVRDLSVVPPVINAINYLASFEDVTVFSYFINKNQFQNSVELKSVSLLPYPKKKISRIIAKLKCWFFFYSFLLKNAKRYDYIWLGVWDYALIKLILKIAGYKGKAIYQLNELEFDQLKYCRKVDYVIVPDENRGWIAYFIGHLKNKPLLLPNIPFLPSSFTFDNESEIDKIKKKYSGTNDRLILYQGHIDYKKRCIPELLTAISNLPENIRLVIMPGNYFNPINLQRIISDIETLKITDRVFIINSVKAPEHLMTVKKADLGIGLYSPTSLNQIYAAPNRLYEFTKFGIPVVLPNFPYFKYLGIKYPYAINTVDPGSIKDITSTILKIFEEPNFTQGRNNAKKFTEAEGNYEQTFNNFWNKIISNSK